MGAVCPTCQRSTLVLRLNEAAGRRAASGCTAGAAPAVAVAAVEADADLFDADGLPLLSSSQKKAPVAQHTPWGQQDD